MNQSIFSKSEQARFLRDYWQKKPLKLPGRFPDIAQLMDPDELAGLATEPHIESRIISGAKKKWRLEHGPFEPQIFSELPTSHWTLLVQDVDKWVPAVADLFDFFSFLPAWRLDDVMISYAAPGGSVGPHLDHYDVFLIQARGQRRWQFASKPTKNEELLDQQPVRILKNFVADREWICAPGDILYLPPGFAHHGVSLDHDCITYSIGFRSPDMSGLYLNFLAEQAENNPVHYSDPNLKTSQLGQLFDQRLAKDLIAFHKSRKIDQAALQIWLGKNLSKPKYDEFFEGQAKRRKGRLRRHEHSRLFFDRSSLSIFMNGEQIQLSASRWTKLSQLLSSRECEIKEPIKEIESWITKGWFYWVPESIAAPSR